MTIPVLQYAYTWLIEMGKLERRRQIYQRSCIIEPHDDERNCKLRYGQVKSKFSATVPRVKENLFLSPSQQETRSTATLFLLAFRIVVVGISRTEQATTSLQVLSSANSCSQTGIVTLPTRVYRFRFAMAISQPFNGTLWFGLYTTLSWAAASCTPFESEAQLYDKFSYSASSSSLSVGC